MANSSSKTASEPELPTPPTKTWSLEEAMGFIGYLASDKGGRFTDAEIQACLGLAVYYGQSGFSSSAVRALEDEAEEDTPGQMPVYTLQDEYGHYYDLAVCDLHDIHPPPGGIRPDLQRSIFRPAGADKPAAAPRFLSRGPFTRPARG